MKSRVEQPIPAVGAVWTEPKFRFSLPKGKLGLRVSLSLVLLVLVGIYFVRLLPKLLRGLRLLQRLRVVSANHESLQLDEYTLHRTYSLAEELLDAVSATNTATLNDDSSSLIRRRRIASHESESESEASVFTELHTTFTVKAESVEVNVTVKDASDEVVNLLTNDPFIKELCSIAILKIDAERFQRNLRRLLKVYCKNSRRNAYTKAHGLAIQLIRQRSRYIAQNVYETITMPMREAITAESSMDLRKARLSEYFIKNWDEDYARRQSPLDSIADFLTESTEFWELRENLRYFLFPSAWSIYREGIRDIICHNKPKMIATL
jgi:hypothetical protein